MAPGKTFYAYALYVDEGIEIRIHEDIFFALYSGKKKYSTVDLERQIAQLSHSQFDFLSLLSMPTNVFIELG